MKALSIKQPWVWAILHAGKEIENRRWTSNHRGWIALHATAKDHDETLPPRYHCPDIEDLDHSAICGVACLQDIRTYWRSKWFRQPDDGSLNYGWNLSNVIALPEPIPCKGMLKLWPVPPAVLRNIKRQLPEVDFSDS